MDSCEQALDMRIAPKRAEASGSEYEFEVVRLLNQGLSSRMIALQFKVSKTSINSMRKRFGVTTKLKGGAPSKVQNCHERRLLEWKLNNHVKTAVEAQQLINQSLKKPISAETVRRVWRKLNKKKKEKENSPPECDDEQARRSKY